VLSKNQKEAAGDLSSYSFHMADLATDASEREKAFLFASKEGRLLYHIDEALRRLYKDDYGVCQTCGETISNDRLEAVPHARLCIKCKEEEERAKGRR
jgi:RNA polymerase-binding protein DksA